MSAARKSLAALIDGSHQPPPNARNQRIMAGEGRWARWRARKKGSSFVDTPISGARAIDRSVIHAGSWIAGTRYKNPWTRRLALVVAFLGFALAGAFLPWPWGLAPITAGVLAIFVVFRHWSR